MIDRKLTILYGSQTGCAQDLAEQIWRDSKRYHFNGPVLSLDSYTVTNLIHECCVIFVCSTTGQGDEPDSMKQFWKFLLRKNLPSDSLSDLNFAVLGLGDSSYVKFNFVAKKLNKRLINLGGNPLIPIGLCDDQHDFGASAISIPWIQNLWIKLLTIYPLSDDLHVLSESPRQFRWKIQIVDDDKENNVLIQPPDLDIYDGVIDSIFDKPFTAEVINNIRTTSKDHFQDVRLISFNVRGIHWNPGDVFVVRPKNLAEKVNRLFEIFAEHNIDLYPETIVQLEEYDKEMPVPKYLRRPLSLQTIATQCWDLNAIPRQRSFELLAINCENDLEKDKLLELTQPECQDDLYSYANRPRRTILEMLADFPHATSKLNINILFEMFQVIRPRSFSIASCAEMNKLEILLAVVQYKTILHEPRLGLCSTWMKQLCKGDRIRGVIKSGTFRLPIDRNVPIIMVGPGTGLAPFRSILCEKFLLNEFTDKEFILFFGCRKEKNDYHCRDDLEKMQQSGFLKVFTAFSRDQDDKIYVQHKIREQQKLISNLITAKNAYVLVAGNSKNMPQSVKEAFIDVIGNKGYVEEMIKSGRYQEETWA